MVQKCTRIYERSLDMLQAPTPFYTECRKLQDVSPSGVFTTMSTRRERTDGDLH